MRVKKLEELECPACGVTSPKTPLTRQEYLSFNKIRRHECKNCSEVFTSIETERGIKIIDANISVIKPPVGERYRIRVKSNLDDPVLRLRRQQKEDEVAQDNGRFVRVGEYEMEIILYGPDKY